MWHKVIIILLLKIISVLLMISSFGNLYGQSKIKCDLIELSYKAFDKSPSIKRSYYSIQGAEANLQIQQGTFNTNTFSELGFRNNRNNLFEADPRNQYIDNVLKSNNVNFSAGLQKRLRTGQLTEVSLSYGLNENNFPFNNFNEKVGVYWGTHTSTINFSLTQPLLRGKGRNVATTFERTSRLYVENSKNNNIFTNSSEILQIGLAYWEYYTAFKSLEIYKQNESRVRNVLDITNELVKADKKPAGDVVQVSADLANQEKTTIMAEQGVFQARLNLGRVIGLNEEESLLLDNPTNNFPTMTESAYKNGLDKNIFIRIAKDRRGDLKAVRQLSEALDVQYKFAENNVKPQLDLTGFVFYGGSTMGNGAGEVFSTLTNYQGRNTGVGARLTFTFPVNNNVAKGNLVKSNVAINDQKVYNDNLQRNVELNISNSVNNLNNSVLALKKAEEALGYYKEAFNNEQVKFQTGLTTILNLILFQERLTSAELRYLQAYQQFANAIIILRHETGTLVNPEGNGFSIDRKAFYSIPDTDN
jgi:outer membrane protein